jgi:hypothetical protein
MPQDPISRVAVRANMLGGAVHGHAGIRDYFRKFTDTFESIRSRSSESCSAGDPLVWWCKCTGEPRASAVDRDSHAHFAARIRDGRTWPVAACRSEQEALEAVGLNRREAREGGPRPPPSAAAASMEERTSRSAATRRSLRTSRDRLDPPGPCARFARRKQESAHRTGALVRVVHSGRPALDWPRRLQPRRDSSHQREMLVVWTRT